jgi:hypothetical protein
MRVQRQGEAHDCTRPRRRDQRQRAAVQLRSTARDGQAEPAAARRGGHERFEHPLAHVGRDARAVVLNLDDRCLALLCNRQGDIHQWIVATPETTAKTKAPRKPAMRAYSLPKEDVETASVTDAPAGLSGVASNKSPRT